MVEKLCAQTDGHFGKAIHYNILIFWPGSTPVGLCLEALSSVRDAMRWCLLLRLIPGAVGPRKRGTPKAVLGRNS